MQASQQVAALREIDSVGRCEEADRCKPCNGPEQSREAKEARKKRERRQHEAAEDELFLAHAERDADHGEEPRYEVRVVNVVVAPCRRIRASPRGPGRKKDTMPLTWKLER